MSVTIIKNSPYVYGCIPVEEFEHDFVYFGSPIKHEGSIEINRPLFVTPYLGIASIFIDRRNRKALGIPPGSACFHYDEWGLPFEELMKPLDTVHMTVEGIPNIPEHSVTLTGYIHRIDVRKLKEQCSFFNHDDSHIYLGPIYRYNWMSSTREFLISSIDHVDIDQVMQHTVHYIVKSADDTDRRG